MYFNSITFAVFCLIVVPIYWWVARRWPQLKASYLVLASLVFYGAWDARFLPLLIFSSITDFAIARRVDGAHNPTTKRGWLYLSLFLNLGLLGYFKYCNFFLESFHYLLGEGQFEMLSIVLPMGISFYTFQSMSYTIDVYRGALKPTNRLDHFMAYITFFPQLVAGPIERAGHLLPQLSAQFKLEPNNVLSGLKTIFTGLIFKLLVADNAAVIGDIIFDENQVVGRAGLVLGGLIFGLQIYADFAGYSLIAIGLGRLLGIRLSCNFRQPYFATSFTDFWRRWHMTLSGWFRDYVYLPMGGSRNGTGKLMLALLVTFIISGLWHGASWNFAIWGLFHGILIALEKLFSNFRLAKTVGWAKTFVLVQLSWVLFRVEDWDWLRSNLVVGETFDFSSIYNEPRAILGMVAGCAIMLVYDFFSSQKQLPGFWIKNTAIRWTGYYTGIILVLLLGALWEAPGFIYFQF